MSGSPPQQYCLRWNNYQNNLTNVFDQLLQSEAFVDVTLACDGHSLKAHKMVLSACSPYFQSLFFDNPCTHPIVILKDIKWVELKSVVEFMYRGEINVSQEQLAPLLKVAEVLKIRGLADVSRGHGSDLLHPHTNANHHSNDGETEHPDRTNGLPHHVSSVHAHLLASLRRKRRKLSNECRERDGSPSPSDLQDDHDHNNVDEHSSNGDFDHSPALSGTAESLAALIPPSNTPTTPGGTSVVAINTGQGIGSAAAAAAAATLSSMSSSLLGLHSSGQGPTPGTSSSVANEMDLKPGIVEMIREEERAKMLESSHGWLGPSASTLSDSYQYQIQSLWQKCWNTNQPGMVHALRFRERGPLKSWRPETMAEAIFAVLREGLSLSQAARKYDIPYPTFVLYANRVHNMLGPSADGCTDLLADMRPKGRGRPQRILLGSWPEDHIRGVIRAVVFRDTGGKDDVPFVFNRQQQQPGPSSHNGLDMSLHPQFGSSSFGASNPMGGASSSMGSSSGAETPIGHPQHQGTSSSSSPSASPMQVVSIGGNGQHHGHHGVNAHSQVQSQLLASISQQQRVIQQQQQQQQQQHGHHGQHTQHHHLAQQQHHGQHQQVIQHHRSSIEESPSSSPMALPLPLTLTKTKAIEYKLDPQQLALNQQLNSEAAEILQIKAEIPFDDDDEDDMEDELSNSEDEDEESVTAAAAMAAVAMASEGHLRREREVNTPSPHFQSS